MRRARSFRRRGSKRSVAWIPGLSYFASNLDTTTAPWSVVVGGGTTWGTATALTAIEDLQSHGGEDAVLTRITGRIMLLAGQVNAGAGLLAADFFYRALIVQQDTLPAGGGILGVDYTTFVNMGRDNILWYRDGYCSRATQVDSVAPMTSQVEAHWLDVNVKAKRKLQDDRPIYLWFQSAFPVGTTGVQTRFAGGLRTLLMRPR